MDTKKFQELKARFLCLGAALLFSFSVCAEEYDEVDAMLLLPTAHLLPMEAQVNRVLRHGSNDQYTLSMRSRAFEIEAPVFFKGWRVQRQSNGQVILHNFLVPEAKVTFSFFNSFLFFQQAQRLEDWELAYYNGLVIEGSVASDISAEETFPDVGRFPHYLFGRVPAEIIDYEKMNIATEQKSFCRDIFIEYRATAEKRYTLLIQLERPAGFPSKAFADVFRSLHAVDHLASIAD